MFSLRSLLSIVVVLLLAAAGALAVDAKKEYMQQALRGFNLMDANDDGFIDKDELAVAFRGPNAKPPETPSSPGTESPSPSSSSSTSPDWKYPDQAYLAWMDTSGDGKIGRKEFSAAIEPYAEQFARMYQYQADLARHQKRLAQKIGQAERREVEAAYKHNVHQLHVLTRELHELRLKQSKQQPKK